MEPVGFAVGVATGVPGTIKNCIDLYSYIRKWNQREGDLNHHLLCLWFEEERFRVYEEGLTRIHRIDSPGTTQRSMLDDILTSKQETLDNIKTCLDKHNMETKGKKRIAYVLNDEPDMRRMAARLTDLNNMLEFLLPHEAQESARYRFRTNMLTERNMADLFRISETEVSGQNKDVIAAAQIKMLISQLTSGVQFDRAHAANAGDKRFSRATDIKWSEINVSKGFPTWGKTCSLSTLHDHERTYGSLSTRALAHSTSSTVTQPLLVEWRSGFKSSDQGSTHSTPAHRLNQLSHTLQKMSEAAEPSLTEARSSINFRILRCAGWIATDSNFQRVGLVFSFPRNKTEVPLSLHSYIKTTEQGRNRLNLDVRFDMARALSRSVANLMAIGWLHRSFRSDNVLLFDLKGYKELYVVGHSYTRPSSGVSDELSTLPDADPEHRLYRPPCDMAGWWDVSDSTAADGTVEVLPDESSRAYRINAGFDVFALGIVLLELGYWRTAKSLEKELQGKHKGKVLDRAALLVYVNGLGYRAGNKYRDVVRRCLELEDDWLLGSVDPQSFMAQVLEDLNTCRV